MNTQEKLHILLLEDVIQDAELIKKNIRQAGILFRAVIVSDKSEFAAAMLDQSFDIILAKHSLPDFSSEEALAFLHEQQLAVPMILVTSTVPEDFEITILKQGVDDYILKNNMERLPIAIKMAIGRRKAEKEKDSAIAELSLSEQKYKVLFESSPLPMWVISRSTFAFISVNNAAAEHYGYSIEEFLKMSTKDIRLPEDVDRYAAYIAKNINEEKTHSIWRHKKKNGEIIFVELFGHDYLYDGQSVRLVLMNDITEKLKTEEKLTEALEEARHLAASLQSVREEERTMMAREIHDQLGQMLTALRLEISRIKSKMPDTENELKGDIIHAIKTTDEVIVTVRSIASRLRPALLDDMGLAAAMEWQCREFRKTTGVTCIFSEEGNDGNLDKNLATGLFRLFQEALTNIIRHASATKVQVSLVVETGEVTLTVKDNGAGFNHEEVKRKKTLGLTGMKERALLMNGKFELKSSPEAGTLITVNVKL